MKRLALVAFLVGIAIGVVLWEVATQPPESLDDWPRP